MAKFDELEDRVTALELFRLEQEEAAKKNEVPTVDYQAVSLEKRVAALEKLCKEFRK